MDNRWMDEISLLMIGLGRKWAGHWGPLVEQVANLGNHLILSSAVLCHLGPLVHFCLYGGETGLQESDRERGERNDWKMVDRP